MASTKKPASRRVKQQPYKSFRLQKRIKHPGARLPEARKVLWRSLRHLRKYYRLFGGIVIVYLLLTLVFVSGLGTTTNIGDLKGFVEEVFAGTGNFGTFLTGATLFGILLSSAGTTPNDASGAYQMTLLVIFSLVFIWTLRQTHAKARISLRDTFYKSLYPTIPFLLVLCVVGLQLLPILLLNLLYSAVFGTGLAVTGLEQALWLLLFFFLALFSLYMLTSSLFALYIVTLPDMRPMQALSSARELVRYRRWTIMRKVFFMPVALILLGGVIMLPVLLYATAAAEWVFIVLNMVALAAVHSYMYSLYRELL